MIKRIVRYAIWFMKGNAGELPGASQQAFETISDLVTEDL